MTISTDQNDRRMAASSLDHNVLVLAGAGTGKTTLLIDRLTLLILGKEVPVEKIVALTFTKKAAEEMRERLESRLRNVIAGTLRFELMEEIYSRNKSRWVELAAKALEDIPKAQIGTIHSFAAHLLRLYPLQSGVDPSFREDEGTFFESVFEKEWIIWLKEELRDDSTQFEVWESLLREMELSELKALAKALCSPMVDLSRVDNRIALKEIYLSVRKELADLITAHSYPKRPSQFSIALKTLEGILEDACRTENGLYGFPDGFKSLMDPLDSPVKEWAEAKSAIKKLKRRVVSLSRVDESLIKSAAETVLPLVHRVRRELRQRGSVSFDGLLVFARDLVKNHPDVRSAIKNRFETFLVDEFQDTDPIQGEILFYLSEAPVGSARDWRDVELTPGRLFVVGDPKQSIYRFRGADVAAFEAFQRKMIQEGARLATLSINFRSRPPIIEFANTVFPTVMKVEPYLQPEYVPLIAGRSESGKESDSPLEMMVMCAEPDSGILSADEGRAAEAETIAEWIKTHVPRDHRYSDITLLFRSSNAFPSYLDALRRWDIPYLVEGEKSFYLTSEIVDFMNLIAAIANPADKLALVGVLRSPIAGLTDKEILDLSEKNSLDYRQDPAVHNDKAGPFYKMLRQLAEFSSENAVSRTVKEILNRSRIMELNLHTSYGEQALANLLKIHFLSRKWEDEAPLSLSAFSRRLRDYREEERQEGENPMADVNFDAVKIMTVHKSKGLEFPVVILPNLSSVGSRIQNKEPFASDWRSGLVGLRLPKSKKMNSAMFQLEEDIARREEAEEVRIFFVAVTRAKEKLICVRSHTKDRGRFSSYLDRSGACPSPGLDMIQFGSISIPVKTNRWNENLYRKMELDSVPLTKTWEPVLLAKEYQKRANFKASLQGQRIIVTPSFLIEEGEKIRDSDEPFSSGSTSAIRIGHLCHKVMEMWDFDSGISVREQLEIKLENASRLYEVNPERKEDKELLSECADILNSFFKTKEYARLKGVRILGREIPFSYSLSDVFSDSPRVMRGVIDLLYEEAGRVVVADYKTNRVDAGRGQKLQEHYRPQAEIYRAAVKKAIGKEAGFELLFLRDGSRAVY